MPKHFAKSISVLETQFKIFTGNQMQILNWLLQLSDVNLEKRYASSSIEK